MTVEHKIVVGLDDIKAVIFECRQCRTRVSMSPTDATEIPVQCPQRNCASVWITGRPSAIRSEHDSSTSAHINFVSAIGYIRKHNGAAFRILLEFDNQSKQDAPAPS
jgi:hypothetical protein